ncbi:ParB N-terminal domain-containing protein [Streptomyces sp. NPDC087850]|uniref:ParB N-terminal domain-containing protein n=1 Tax=Streptomyces sp. NPDC087850 TaxID=3365809 RepID=UPI0037F58F81
MKSTTIALSEIVAEPSSRDSSGDVEGLKMSIRSNRLREPLLIAAESNVLLSGYRRLAACKSAAMRNVPVLVAEDVLEACNHFREHMNRDNRYVRAVP